ncbi:hypothetical protein [Sphingomonas colocasiae]|uniref:Transmembrane protein n=1 Tax=Sphingomonas colocasiae TaxID=1848973 RepID=A0ABS7PN68_9SPHN|nr:hypothetical protein [Sphingomonas colocasiae]MBY8821897.1 hypothetical protein [Sphingomonas colocasiae]
MNAQARHISTRGGLVMRAAPVAIVALAILAVRTPLAAAYPRTALLLFLWAACDTLMLAAIARAPGRNPGWHAVPAVLAAASLIVWLGSPPALRQALLAMPAIAIAMIAMVLAHIAWATARARRIFRRTHAAPGMRWTAAASAFLPVPVVRAAAATLSITYLSLVRWGGPADVPSGSRAFAYHRHLAPMCATMLVLSLIELGVCHLLLGLWSPRAALIVSALSGAGLVYLIALIKSFRIQPVLMTGEGVRVRAGLAIDQAIPLDAIAAIETGFAGSDVNAPETLNAALLAWPNILLRLRRPIPGRRGPVSAVAFRLDDPDPFVRLLKWRMEHFQVDR